MKLKFQVSSLIQAQGGSTNAGDATTKALTRGTADPVLGANRGLGTAAVCDVQNVDSMVTVTIH